MNAKNRHMTLRRYPEGMPQEDDFALLEAPMPEVMDGAVLGRAMYLTVDPYIRARMSARFAEGYADRTALGEPIGGEAVYEVVQSRHRGFKEGDLFAAFGGWQEFCALPGEGLRRVDPALGAPAHHLGALGMPGLTAYAGLTRLADAKPGDAIFVSAALGGVGSVAGAIGRDMGCRMIGVSSSAEKCRYAVDSLGYHVCIDRTAPDFATQVSAACPHKIDVNFENVGGDIFWLALSHMKAQGRVVVCGLVSGYNDDAPPPGPDLTGVLLREIALKRLVVKGLMVADFWSLYPEFQAKVGALIRSGAFAPKVHVVEGIENAGRAMIDMLSGRSFGKTVVRVGRDPTLG
ncbi:MAG: NADP-dependent oxidoreductase [Hyphomonadaceae bacterium]|nr:NADP-dependent oxidoreductase [Hyphomonadaceae bacterium]